MSHFVTTTPLGPRVSAEAAHTAGYALATSPRRWSTVHLIDLCAEDSETWPHALCGTRPAGRRWDEVGLPDRRPYADADCQRCITRATRALESLT